MSARSKHAPVDERPDSTADAIDQLGAFLASAIETPGLLDFFPETGELAFRELDIHGHAIQLTAVHPDGADARMARPSRYALKAGSLVFQRPIPNIPDDPDDLIGRTLGIVERFGASAPTAAEALERLEAELRAAIGEAVQIDLEAVDRRRHG